MYITDTTEYEFLTDFLEDYEGILGRDLFQDEAHAIEIIWNMEPEALSVLCYLLNVLDGERGGGWYLKSSGIDNTAIKDTEEQEDTKTCCLCGRPITGSGNNPWPLDEADKSCCDECNSKHVIQARARKKVNSLLHTLGH